MNNKAIKTIRRYNMLSRGDSVIAAVSGGADSMALICLLLDLREKYRLNISVCHINHLFRGDEADRDENFVRSFCQKHSIPFYLLRCDVAAKAKEQKIGFEECGRQVRYDFLKETAKNIGFNVKIATAHTLSDCGETLIFNITRGCSPAAVASIAPKRDNIIRPLIECTREEIESYLLQRRQTYMVDSTNADGAYNRNFIRKEIVPRLKKLNPSFDLSVLNLTALARQQADFISECIKKESRRALVGGGIDKSVLLELHPAIASGIIAEFFRNNNIEFSKKRCDEIFEVLESETFKISVCKNGYILCRGDGILRFEVQYPPQKATDFCIPLREGIFDLEGGREIRISKIRREDFENLQKSFPELLKNCINYDIANPDFVIRFRREGDFISLFPRNVTKSLKKLFNESKIPAQKRNIIPVIAYGSHVLWGEGIGVDRAAAIDAATKQIIFIEVFDKTN